MYADDPVKYLFRDEVQEPHTREHEGDFLKLVDHGIRENHKIEVFQFVSPEIGLEGNYAVDSCHASYSNLEPQEECDKS